jgi:hypothetical protein
MKKLFILSIVLLGWACTGYAQSTRSFYNKSFESRNSGSFDQSAMLLSFGLGFPNVAVGYNGLAGFPPLYVKYEQGFLRDDVGLGGYFSTSFGSVRYFNNNNNTFSVFSFGLLGYYHFNKLIPIEKMDVYAGAGLGFRTINYSNDGALGVYPSETRVMPLMKVGIRYYLTPKLAPYAETGYDGMSSLNIGLTVRLR